MDPDDARETAIRRFGDITRVNTTCRAIGKQRDKTMRHAVFLGARAGRHVRVPAALRQSWVHGRRGADPRARHWRDDGDIQRRPVGRPSATSVSRLRSYCVNLRRHEREPDACSAGNYTDGIEPVSAFSAVTAQQFSSFNLSDGRDTERVIGGRVTAGFFNVFNLPPALGRVFTKEEDQPGREQVAVLSHRLWTRRFGADSSIVGRQITLNERPHDVIGVMPARFDYTADGMELWVPIAFTAARKAMHDEHYLLVAGQLKPDATVEQALGELRQRHAASHRFSSRCPGSISPSHQRCRPGRRLLAAFAGSSRRRRARPPHCLRKCRQPAPLARRRPRRRARHRAALGAGRARIARQLLTESIVLALLSAAVGLGLAAWGIRAWWQPRRQECRGSSRRRSISVLAFTLLVTLASAVLFGVAPALRAARVDVQTVIKAGGRSAGMGGIRDRLRTALIVAELAVALVLLVGAGLLIRSSLALQRVDPGFNPEGVLNSICASSGCLS